VEEKVDGANVSLWLEDGRVLVGARGGTDTMDRGSQFGRLRGWVAEHDPALRPVLDSGWAMYAEWLWVRHGVPYSRLPGYLVVLDLWRGIDGFASVDTRDALATAVGLPTPPRLFKGVLGSRERLDALIGRSRFSDNQMEGVVLRLGDDRAKVVAPGYRRRTDREWAGRQEHNELALR
jgi:hypothetical protein